MYKKYTAYSYPQPSQKSSDRCPPSYYSSLNPNGQYLNIYNHRITFTITTIELHYDWTNLGSNYRAKNQKNFSGLQLEGWMKRIQLDWWWSIHTVGGPKALRSSWNKGRVAA